MKARIASFRPVAFIVVPALMLLLSGTAQAQTPIQGKWVAGYATVVVEPGQPFTDHWSGKFQYYPGNGVVVYGFYKYFPTNQYKGRLTFWFSDGPVHAYVSLGTGTMSVGPYSCPFAY